MHWNPEKLGPCLELTEDDYCVTNHTRQGVCCANARSVEEFKLNSGVYTWAAKIDGLDATQYWIAVVC